MIWDFPKIRGTFFGGPYNKDPTIQGTILGSPLSETPILTAAQRQARLWLSWADRTSCYGLRRYPTSSMTLAPVMAAY